MSLIWAESFDLYGTSLTALGERGYIVTGSIGLVDNPANARTGNGSFFTSAALFDEKIVRINSDPMERCTQGCAFNVAGISFDSNAAPGFYFRIGSNDNAIRACLNNQLGVSVWQGGTKLGNTAANQYAANNYFYMECQVNAGIGDASIVVRINGNIVLSIIGLTISDIDGFGIGRGFIGEVSNCRYDDWTVADGLGTLNNSFLGDRRCETAFVDADTALADWTPSTGTSGFAILDNMPPNDGQYVEGSNSGDISEFELTPMGIATNDVAGIVIIGRSAKDEGGTADFRLGINSAGFVNNGPLESPNVTPSYSYFQHVVERNPNGNIPWTRTTRDAALPRLTRD